jgi:hypothetical protein
LGNPATLLGYPAGLRALTDLAGYLGRPAAPLRAALREPGVFVFVRRSRGVRLLKWFPPQSIQ